MVSPDRVVDDRAVRTLTRSRRQLLGGAGAGIASLLAGCVLNGGDGDDGTDDPDGTTDDGADDPDGTTDEGTEVTEATLESLSPTFEVESTDAETPEKVLEVQGIGLKGVEWETFGQSFTVESGFGEVGMYVTNYGDDKSAFNMTLHRGSPSDSEFEEIDWEWVEAFQDDSWQTATVEVERAGTYYLEMSEPNGFPSWYWRTEEPPAVGGSAYIDRERVDDGVFVFRVA